MSKASAREATSLPMRPSPIKPRVLPRTSVPEEDFSQRPSRRAAVEFGNLAGESEEQRKSGVRRTLTAFPPGVLMTRTPRRVASCKSMLSTPTPARPTARKSGSFRKEVWRERAWRCGR